MPPKRALRTCERSPRARATHHNSPTVDNVFFYSAPFRVVKSLGPGDDAPRIAKLSAALSLLIMVGVMCCGRMLTFFRPPMIS